MNIYETILQNMIEEKIADYFDYGNGYDADVTTYLKRPDDETDNSVMFESGILFTRFHYSGHVLDEINLVIHGYIDCDGVTFQNIKNMDTGKTYTEADGYKAIGIK